jgi:hypothetical protein
VSIVSRESEGADSASSSSYGDGDDNSDSSAGTSIFSDDFAPDDDGSHTGNVGIVHTAAKVFTGKTNEIWDSNTLELRASSWSGTNEWLESRRQAREKCEGSDAMFQHEGGGHASHPINPAVVSKQATNATAESRGASEEDARTEEGKSSSESDGDRVSSSMRNDTNVSTDVQPPAAGDASQGATWGGGGGAAAGAAGSEDDHDWECEFCEKGYALESECEEHEGGCAENPALKNQSTPSSRQSSASLRRPRRTESAADDSDGPCETEFGHEGTIRTRRTSLFSPKAQRTKAEVEGEGESEGDVDGKDAHYTCVDRAEVEGEGESEGDGDGKDAHYTCVDSVLSLPDDGTAGNDDDDDEEEAGVEIFAAQVSTLAENLSMMLHSEYGRNDARLICDFLVDQSTGTLHAK